MQNKYLLLFSLVSQWAVFTRFGPRGSSKRLDAKQETLCYLSQGTGWYLASWSWLCSAVLRHRHCRASAQHCTAMTNWPNTIRCLLGSDDLLASTCATKCRGQRPTRGIYNEIRQLLESLAPEYFVYAVLHHVSANNFGKNYIPRVKATFFETSEFRI